MGWRGAERAERKGEWLEKQLRGYVEPDNKHEDLPIMVILKD